MKGQEETSFAIVRACVPRGTGEKLSRALAVSAETVNRWGRPPQDDEESPAGTGLSNPIDRVMAILEHAFCHAPDQAHRIPQYFTRRYERFVSALGGNHSRKFSDAVRDKELSDIHGELADLFRAILLRASPAEVRKEFEDVKRECEELVRMIEESQRSEVRDQRSEVSNRSEIRGQQNGR